LRKKDNVFLYYNNGLIIVERAAAVVPIAAFKKVFVPVGELIRSLFDDESIWSVCKVPV
jgi:hypothetical protein